MNLTDTARVARVLMNDHGLGHWVFEFDGSKRRRGCTHWYPIKKITLSRYLTPLREDTDVINTILHEIAHALVGSGHGHDAVWQAKAREIGCTAERCSSDQVEAKPNWHGVCMGCNKVISKRFRRPKKGRTLVCSLHKLAIVWIPA